MAAIKSLEAGIYQKFDAHAAEFRKEISSLREEVHNSLTAVTSEVNAHEERLTSLENATSAWTTSLQVLEPAVASLLNEIAALQAKCTDLECRSRRSNVRLVGIPEGMEGIPTNMCNSNTFRITHDGVEHKFDTPAEAMDYVKQHLMTP